MEEPFARFARWYVKAEASEPNDPNACALATVVMKPTGPEPDVRIVLLKGHDARGFVFYTNRQSAKGLQLADQPVAALGFHWKSLRRQVRVRGTVEPVPDLESDAYFATRPRESQLSAWASRQSRPLASREAFEAALAETAERFPGAVPRPPCWGGYRLSPHEIEYWEDRPGRQHHRELHRLVDGRWVHTLIYP